jgi:hypothetical protein
MTTTQALGQVAAELTRRAQLSELSERTLVVAHDS